MNVPYFDLKAQYANLRDEILPALDRVCKDASFILGEEVARFEREFAAYCQTKYCLALNSGTSALHLALLGAGVAPGDEVILPAYTFIATAEAVSYTGAQPVFVDSDPRTGNIDPKRIEEAITSRTRVILPVHLYGRPADLDVITEIAERHHLTVIEDACQAHGARYRGRRVGGLGRAAAFSFYPGKNLGAYGEGGALTTDDEALARTARTLRDHGQAKRYFHDLIGYNYRMDGFQGAVLRVKLAHLDEWTARRREFAGLYRELLADTPVDLPADDPESESVYHLMVVWVDDRDEIRTKLESRGVGTAIHYPIPVHLQRCYAHLGYKPGSLPNIERACLRCVSMPLFPEMTDEQVRWAASSLAEVAEETCGAGKVSR